MYILYIIYSQNITEYIINKIYSDIINILIKHTRVVIGCLKGTHNKNHIKMNINLPTIF